MIETLAEATWFLGAIAALSIPTVLLALIGVPIERLLFVYSAFFAGSGLSLWLFRRRILGRVQVSAVTHDLDTIAVLYRDPGLKRFRIVQYDPHANLVPSEFENTIVGRPVYLQYLRYSQEEKLALFSENPKQAVVIEGYDQALACLFCCHLLKGGDRSHALEVVQRS